MEKHELELFVCNYPHLDLKDYTDLGYIIDEIRELIKNNKDYEIDEDIVYLQADCDDFLADLATGYYKEKKYGI